MLDEDHLLRDPRRPSLIFKKTRLLLTDEFWIPREGYFSVLTSDLDDVNDLKKVKEKWSGTFSKAHTDPAYLTT